MTNLEAQPAEQLCVAGPAVEVELIEPRDVPLGGPRAMTVRRTLPSRQRSLVGPFCFLDHYGPDDVATSGMDVAPHPHTGLQAVTWLFEGQVLHQDSLGSVQTIHPGQLNLMTAGRGISHSEEGTRARFPHQRRLHGVQLWTALPEAHRHGPPTFEHVAAVPAADVDGVRVQVFLGELAGVGSPARAFSPVVAAQLDLPAGAVLCLPVRPDFEHAVLPDDAPLTVADREVPATWLAYLAPGRSELVLRAAQGPARAVLIGGAPFAEEILMWWNFVGRSHEEVVQARAEWQAGVATRSPGQPPDDGRPPGQPPGADLAATGLARFGTVPGYPGGPLPAPELPHVRLRPRARSGEQ